MDMVQGYRCARAVAVAQVTARMAERRV